jgi:shikimate kinase
MAPKAVLIGLPGSGKSTIGRRLAKAMGLTMLDTDAAIEEKTGRTIAEIFTGDGEQEFRRIEEEVIRDALRTHDGILSLGGGAVTTPGVREALAGRAVVLLEITAAEGIRRTGGNTARPLLAGPDHAEKYRKLMNDRVPLYRRVATIRVNTNRRNPGAVVRYIISRMENPVPPRRRRPPWRRSSTPQAEKRPATAPPAPTPKPVESAPVTPATPAALAARRAGVRK